MKIKSILAQAAKCNTQEDAQNLLETMKRVFGNHKLLSHLGIYNEEYYMEGDKPFVRFELNREISDEYVTMIRPEIRDGKLIVVVQMNRMKDKLGMWSKDFETIDGMDDDFEQDGDQTIHNLCNRVADQAIAYHRLLIESVGVPEAVAKKTAKASW
jgi:hypothetical protein